MTYNDEDRYIMTKKDYVRREKEWKKCVEWFRNAHDVAETIREQLPRIAHCEDGHDDDDMQLDGFRIAQGVRRSSISVISQCMMITACKSVTICDADKIVFAQKITA